ncbi:MAG: recombinase family protein [Afipia sp.]|nr:recombinase family protein [Afipia sp.]
MMAQAKKTLRCAVYTRKSTEHNLDLEFNSLDAQREACEAYIKSQMHEGWVLVPTQYNDGGLSGASLNRPALQTLLEDVRVGKVDVIVVYKVDRLTRALSDFAKLVELFDAHNVSFVSVTQSFNTTSSMGRLTLNVLLSFAQFEREVIGERVRDKIAASKKKGIWVGGPLPLGYVSKDKKVIVVSDEAETVRDIFRRYLDLGSIGALAKDLNKRGIRTKRQNQSGGRVRGGVAFGTGALSHLLNNRFYIGEVVYHGQTNRGDYEPIVSQELFDAVQTMLASKTVERENRLKGSSAILMGRIYDDRGNRMTPSHTNKKGARYRYYVSHPTLQHRGTDAGTVRRVSASDIESLVVQTLKAHFQNPANETENSDTANRDLIERFVDRIVVKPNAIEIAVRGETAENDSRDSEPTQTISVPWSAPAFTLEKGIIHAPKVAAPMSAETRDTLLLAIAKARGWIAELTDGSVTSLAEIAKREGKVERHIRLLAPLAFVSPKIIAAIVDGAAPAGMTVTDFAYALPFEWAAQEREINLTTTS